MKLQKFDPDRVWLTSDTHYGHSNICLGISGWEDKTGCRNFKTIEEMNEAIVLGINSNVKQQDILIHLGDWSFGGASNIQKFRDRIICQNIHWILGNHDTHHNEYQDLFVDLYFYLEIMVGSQMLCLMHYPIEEWNDRHKKSWMLHGHSHGESRIIPRRLDVGVDNAFKLFGEYRPMSFKDISNSIKLM